MARKLDSSIILIVEKSNGEYWVTVDGLDGCFTVGASLKEAIDNAQTSIEEHIEALLDSGIEKDIPSIFLKKPYTFQVKYDLQSLFEEYSIINKSALAQIAGINSSLLRQYSTGLAFASEKQRDKIVSVLNQIGTSLSQVV